MPPLFSLDSLISLITLILLEIVLGIDNVIFVSILIVRLPVSRQRDARFVWMIAGILIRSGLLLCLGWLVTNGNRGILPVGDYRFSARNLVLLAGGLFLLYKTVGEFHNRLEGEGTGEKAISSPDTRSFAAIATQIVVVDTVFSADSIITAVGLAQHVAVMITAVVIAMILMFFFSGGIAAFLSASSACPRSEVLALSFLLMVGLSAGLIPDGLEPLHHTHIDKGYIYFSMAFAFGVELLNSRVKKKAMRKK